ncbi:SHOCT domain-containing protein [Paenibacillus filicis]|uniref:SHOCT domain-containing protein n=1 Tax=Paenibacillus gyeongsangnamensis TaxID=3388067 RepID=A0ABT4QDA3_9BACL|nr:SHOCT domain-containing protein [Paenibacillus filicis]MCZ8514798.1 SHOCT domain-containing protein [Paenibacillus filicis]
MMMGYGYGYGMGWIGMLVHLLFIVGVIYLVIKLVVGNGIGSRRDEKQAENILADRFARGEITEEEYMRMKDVLRK